MIKNYFQSIIVLVDEFRDFFFTSEWITVGFVTCTHRDTHACMKGYTFPCHTDPYVAVTHQETYIMCLSGTMNVIIQKTPQDGFSWHFKVIHTRLASLFGHVKK